MLNDPADGNYCVGGRVVAGYLGASDDFAASRDRVGRFLVAVRMAVEADANEPLLPPDVLPPREAVLLRQAVERSLRGGNLTGVAKKLRKGLENFFDDQR
jgi:hypothetical protein